MWDQFRELKEKGVDAFKRGNPGSATAGIGKTTGAGAPHHPPGSPPAGPQASEGTTREKPSVATQLVQLVHDSGSLLFHDADCVTYVRLRQNGHQEVWPLDSSGFERWLSRLFYQTTQKTASSKAIDEALTTLKGQAVHDGPEHKVHVRIAEHAGSIFLDLANADWQAVQITPNGWSIVNDPPVDFVRPNGMLSLPTPQQPTSQDQQRKGSLKRFLLSRNPIDELFEFVNVRSEDRVMLAGWLLMTLHPRGPYPLLGLHGEHGSAKSTTAEMIRSLVDPNSAPLRSPPSKEEDLIIAARNGLVVALDNVSYISPRMSDSYCRLLTGGGMGARRLYTNFEEVLVKVCRPMIITSIAEVVTQADLADRGIFLELPEIPTTSRKTIQDVLGQFEAARPRILGALLSAVVQALRDSNNPSSRPAELSRMADFERWVSAGVSALGFAPDAFAWAYRRNRSGAAVNALEGSPIAGAILDFCEEVTTWPWVGTTKKLLAELERVAEITPGSRRPPGWVNTPRGLTGVLKRLTPPLRQAGILIRHQPQHNSRTKGQLVTITRRETESEEPSTPSNPSTGNDQRPSARAAGQGASSHRLDDVDGVDGSSPAVPPDIPQDVQEYNSDFITPFDNQP
jgi:hypothetical protein